MEDTRGGVENNKNSFQDNRDHNGKSKKIRKPDGRNGKNHKSS
jgi:hypothetical protein